MALWGSAHGPTVAVLSPRTQGITTAGLIWGRAVCLNGTTRGNNVQAHLG